MWNFGCVWVWFCVEKNSVENVNEGRLCVQKCSGHYSNVFDVASSGKYSDFYSIKLPIYIVVNLINYFLMYAIRLCISFIICHLINFDRFDIHIQIFLRKKSLYKNIITLKSEIYNRLPLTILIVTRFRHNYTILTLILWSKLVLQTP